MNFWYTECAIENLCRFGIVLHGTFSPGPFLSIVLSFTHMLENFSCPWRSQQESTVWIQCLEEVLLCLGEVGDLVAHRVSTNYVLIADNELVASDNADASMHVDILSCTILMLTLRMTLALYGLYLGNTLTINKFSFCCHFQFNWQHIRWLRKKQGLKQLYLPYAKINISKLLHYTTAAAVRWRAGTCVV